MRLYTNLTNSSTSSVSALLPPASPPRRMAMLKVNGKNLPRDEVDVVSIGSSMMGADLLCGVEPCRQHNWQDAVAACHAQPRCVGGFGIQHGSQLMRHIGKASGGKTRPSAVLSITLKLDDQLTIPDYVRDAGSELLVTRRLTACIHLRQKTLGSTTSPTWCSRDDMRMWRAHACSQFTAASNVGMSHVPRASDRAPSCVRIILGVFSTAWE